MYICYIDESGDDGINSGRHLLLGGAVIFEGCWSYLNDALERIRKNYFPNVTPPPEFHFSDVRKGGRKYRMLPQERRIKLIDEVCDELNSYSDAELRFFTSVMDKKSWLEKNENKDRKYMYVDLFEQIASRFDFFLRRRYADGKPSKGLIIIDESKSVVSRVFRYFLLSVWSKGLEMGSLIGVVTRSDVPPVGLLPFSPRKKNLD